MKKLYIICFMVVGVALGSCTRKETASAILQKTINTIDTIETIYFNQDMARSDPRNIDDTIIRYREMYFKRLITDSIVGVKGHWYMYVNDKESVIYEDIYDGNKLLRKNNRDSIARIFDLIKFPGFKKKHFWSHNTPYGMQYEFKYILDNLDFYAIDRLYDTVVDKKDCYQLYVRLDNKFTMPGFATKLENMEGSISENLYVIDKDTYYPIRMKGVSYTSDSPDQKVFIDQRYYNIAFNLAIDEHAMFNTSSETVEGFEIVEMRPE